MRHKLKKYNLNAKHSKTRLVMRNLATSLVMYDRLVTTKSRVKSLKSVIDKLIIIAKNKDVVTAIRRLNAYFLDEKASRKMMEVLKDRYQDRPSGFTRVKREGFRAGDGAEKYSIELI